MRKMIVVLMPLNSLHFILATSIRNGGINASEMSVKEKIAITNMELFPIILCVTELKYQGNFMLSFLLTISRIGASQCYIWLAPIEKINFEIKVAASAILLGREMLILLHVIVIDQQRCNHKRDKGILQERCNDVIRVLDNSK